MSENKIKKIECDGVVTIVEEHSIKTMTLMGYKLMGYYQEEKGITLVCEEPDPQPGYSTQTVTTRRPSSETLTKFIMVQDKQSSIAALDAELKARSEELDKAKGIVYELKEQMDITKNEATKSAYDVEQLQKDIEAEETTSEHLRNKWTAAKGDLYKIREVLGTRKIDEILADNEGETDED